MKQNFCYKLIVVVLSFFAGIMTVTAQSSSQITVNVDNGTVKEVLKSIEKQTDYHFAYREDVLAEKKHVTVHLTSTLEKVLDATLKPVGLTYMIISDKTIAIREKDETLPYQRIKEDCKQACF